MWFSLNVLETAIILVFVIGYLAITLEHNLKIDKLIPALVMMAISWALISLGIDFVFIPKTREIYKKKTIRWKTKGSKYTKKKR